MKTKYSDIIAVVMAGGRSKRMGKDKGLIEYKGKAHRYYLADMLKGMEVFDNVVISVPSYFEVPNSSPYDYVKDVYTDLGPLGGLHSMFKSFPNKSLLIVATDMPEIKISDIDNLLNRRDKSMIATCYKNTEGFAEPLFSIWENKSFSIIEDRISNNKLSLMQILKKNPTKLISSLDEKTLININTEEDRFKYLNKG